MVAGTGSHIRLLEPEVVPKTASGEHRSTPTWVGSMAPRHRERSGATDRPAYSPNWPNGRQPIGVSLKLGGSLVGQG